MEQITAFFLSLLDILEKELALFKLTSARAFKGLGWFAMGVFLLGIGLLFLAWTCFTAVSALLGPVGAGLLTSVLILAGGGTFLWIGKKNLK